MGLFDKFKNAMSMSEEEYLEDIEYKDLIFPDMDYTLYI